MVDEPIYHIALRSDWESEPRHPYTTSTLGKTLEQVGFIHCSFRAQVQQIADMVYRGCDAVLLEIESARLAATIQVESPNGGDEAFPHIYGPINRDAVVKATYLRVLRDGQLDLTDAL